MKRNRVESATKINLSDLWDDEINEHAEWLKNKREDTAITLSGTLHAANLSRAELARILDWKPSRVSRILSGHENLTINTLSEIIGATGLDFDILVRPRNECRAFQPWEQASISTELSDLRAQLLSKLDEAKSTCHKAEMVLTTATSISRALFRRAGEHKSRPAIKQTFTYEDDHAPCAREA